MNATCGEFWTSILGIPVSDGAGIAYSLISIVVMTLFVTILGLGELEQ